jgi:hypothetical protein
MAKKNIQSLPKATTAGFDRKRATIFVFAFRTNSLNVFKEWRFFSRLSL